MMNCPRSAKYVGQLSGKLKNNHLLRHKMAKQIKSKKSVKNGRTQHS
jgi:hypothetical protein